MYVTTVRAVQSVKFLEEGSSGVRMRQLLGREDGARQTAMHELSLHKGAYSARHAHEWDHQLVVTSGRGIAIVDDEKVPLRPGVVLLVQSGETHQFFQRGAEPLRFLTVTPI
jgi:quercetin dioxygenase-like cupin family protein